MASGAGFGGRGEVCEVESEASSLLEGAQEEQEQMWGNMLNTYVHPVTESLGNIHLVSVV